MTFLETEMKELGRSTWNNTLNTRSLIRNSGVCPRHRCRQKPLRWKSINTHTQTHTMSANLLQMSKFGGNGDESLKIGINNIFSRKATFEIKHYIEKLVSITTNGASVNTRQHHGRMTQMKKDRRDWLVPIYCVYRWVELVLKDAFDQSGYNEIDKLC